MALVVLLRLQLTAMAAKLATAEATIVELRARLGKNSQNSSKPPSSDMPGGRAPKVKRGKRRERGGQRGHEARFAADPAHVDAVKEYRASTCEHCHADLAKGELTGSCVDHYVYELPEIRPIVTDHRCLCVKCPNCGLVTEAKLPPEVPAGQYGPSTRAMVGLLRGELRQSVRQTSTVMTQVLHVPMSTGMVAKTQEQVSHALAAPHAEALEHAQRSDRAHADETSWRENKKKAWLWVSVTSLVTVFLIHASRGKEAAKQLLGAHFDGILITDRWASYNWVETLRRQLCWSHLKRDFKSFLDYGPEAKLLGERLLSSQRKMFKQWHRFREDKMTRAELQIASQSVRRRILALLDEGTALSNSKVSGMCRQMLKLQAGMFTFIDFDRVEPTNNAAERAVRFAVLMRKGCFGSDSAKGSRFIERFLTARATLRAQNRDLYTYLKDACTAALHQTPAPSLLPKCPRHDVEVAVAA